MKVSGYLEVVYSRKTKLFPFIYKFYDNKLLPQQPRNVTRTVLLAYFLCFIIIMDSWVFIYLMYFIPSQPLFFLMFKLSHLCPQSSFTVSFLSGTRCPRFILFISCLRPGQGPGSFAWTLVFRNHNEGVKMLISARLFQWVELGQSFIFQTKENKL